MDLVTILFIVLFIVVPIVERVLKRPGTGRTGRAPQRRPAERVPGPPRQRTQRLEPRPARRDATGRAPVADGPVPWWEQPEEELGRFETAPPEGSVETDTRPRPRSSPGEVLRPEDLWTILTGDVPPSRRQPEPARYEEAEEDAQTLEAGSQEGEAQTWEEGFRQRGSLETIFERDAPRTVSLEAPLPKPGIRHDTFHQRLEALPPAAALSRRASPTARRLGLRDAGDLRRAVLLMEVLGPPKALEERGPGP